MSSPISPISLATPSPIAIQVPGAASQPGAFQNALQKRHRPGGGPAHHLRSNRAAVPERRERGTAHYGDGHAARGTGLRDVHASAQQGSAGVSGSHAHANVTWPPHGSVQKPPGQPRHPAADLHSGHHCAGGGFAVLAGELEKGTGLPPAVQRLGGGGRQCGASEVAGDGNRIPTERKRKPRCWCPRRGWRNCAC